MSRFTDYNAVAEPGAVTPIWRHQLLGPDGTLLATTDPVEVTGQTVLWGASLAPMAVEGARFSTRSATLQVVTPDGAFVPSGQGSFLHPQSGNRVRVSAGFMLDGEPVYFEQATMVILDASAAQANQVVSVRLVDPLRPVDSQLTENVLVTAGETISAVVERLLSELENVTIAPITFTLPDGGFRVGDDRRPLVNSLLESAGHELTADRFGLVYSREIPPTTDTPGAERWRYGVGGLPINDARRVWASDRPQGFTVKSGDFQSDQPAFTKQIFDTDPSSEGYFEGPGECRCPEITYPFAQSNAQLAAAGYGQIRRHGFGPWMIDIDVSGNPAMRPGDLIDIELPWLRISGPGRVVNINGLPLQNEQLMTVRVRGTYDPALNYDPPAENNNDSGCLTTFSDLFDRPDENLEDLESSPGSAVWSELQYSWYIAGEQAIQRYDRGWSLGFVNTPFCFSDMAATMQIGSIPTGRFVGPLVRSSSEIDGYTAMCDSSGVVRLEMWYAAKKVSELGSHDSGGPLDGKDVEVRAVGTTISVRIDGTTVISITDDSRTGAYAGMLGYGGWPPNSPSVNQFSVASAS